MGLHTALYRRRKLSAYAASVGGGKGMNDLISRQATIVVIECSGLDDDSKDTVVRVLEQLPSAQPEIIRCKECKHFHYDMPYVIQGIPVLGHEVCDFWGDGCKTSENGFCSYAERRTDD